MAYGMRRVCLVAVFCVCLLCMGVQAKLCPVTRRHMAWRHNEGMFRFVQKVGTTPMWAEYDKAGHLVHHFVESGRDESQVLLEDRSRDVRLMLKEDVSGIWSEPDHAFKQLYPGTFIPVVDCRGRPLVLGEDLLPMLPSNDIFYDPPKLRQRLDEDGYLYFKNILPREVSDAALDEVAGQMLRCGWTLEKDRTAQVAQNGFALGVPFPSTHITRLGGASRGAASAPESFATLPLPPPAMHHSPPIREAVSGTSVMAVVRQVFGGAVHAAPVQTLLLGAPYERFGFRMPSVLLNKGTKLALIGLVPLHDIPLQLGPPVLVRGSNMTESYAAIRQTYGQWEVESGDIRGDECYTMDAAELAGRGRRPCRDLLTGAPSTEDVNPFVSTAFEAGDLVLVTVYTMYAYLTNQTHLWRLMAEAVWTMEGDDVGCDPRYATAEAAGLSAWYGHRDDPARHPRTMDEAKRAWGLTRHNEAQEEKKDK